MSEVVYCKLIVPVNWDEAYVDQQIDENGIIPCRERYNWCPIIQLDKGLIINWILGKSAETNYKVCDEGSYFLLDEKKEVVMCIENGYVPNNLIPGEFGDYISMDIDKNGYITNWNSFYSLVDFKTLKK